MSDLVYSASLPFKVKGKDALKDMEFILTLSMDLKLFDPQQAKMIISEALKSGLLMREGELVKPAFDITGTETPPGWKPESVNVEKKSIFDRTIERILGSTGIEKRKLIAMINKKQEELSKMVVIEVCAILVAIENGVTVDDLIDEEYAALGILHRL